MYVCVWLLFTGSVSSHATSLHMSTDYDLGRLQSGERLGNVLLPNWAATPEDFIRAHREALVRERERGGGGLKESGGS